VSERTEPWPEDSLCYKCEKPVGKPWSQTLIPRRPVCAVCAWNNISAALKNMEENDHDRRRDGG
jgi:hypothetical protein